MGRRLKRGKETKTAFAAPEIHTRLIKDESSSKFESLEAAKAVFVSLSRL